MTAAEHTARCLRLNHGEYLCFGECLTEPGAIPALDLAAIEEHLRTVNVAHEAWGNELAFTEAETAAWQNVTVAFYGLIAAVPDLVAEVRRLSARPSLDDVTLAARDVINDGFGPDIRISGPDAGRIARAVLALFPQVDA